MVLSLVGCAHYPVNPRLDHYEPGSGYRLQNMNRSDDAPGLLVVLTFSGGGTRAAALAYGVLEVLNQTEITWEGRRRRLMDEVGLISAVSGGSFTAAYYGLFGKRIFEDFEDRFLKADIEKVLLHKLLSPLNWIRLASLLFDRTELASEYFDEHLFDGGTFSDIAARGGPTVLINATDLTQGMPFSFNQQQFDWICSDVSRFPVARAVAASSAVPVLLSPITLRNYGGSCDYQPPSWVAKAMQPGQTASRQLFIARKRMLFLDADKRRYIHLVDGGLTDNLGLRSVLDDVFLTGNAWETMQAVGFEDARKVVFIVVNAQVELARNWDLHPNPPPIAKILNAATSVPLNRYNFETVELLRQSFKGWNQQIQAKRCANAPGPCDGIDFYLVEVGFDALDNAQERAYLKQLPTSLYLPADSVERLRAAAARILYDSEEFQRLLRDLHRRR